MNKITADEARKLTEAAVDKVDKTLAELFEMIRNAANRGYRVVIWTVPYAHYDSPTEEEIDKIKVKLKELGYTIILRWKEDTGTSCRISWE